MTSALPPARLRVIAKVMEMAGILPDEIAATVVHLARPAAGFITGQIVQINGASSLVVADGYRLL